MPDNMQKKPKHKWYVGIDFGTTNTYVVAYDEENDKLYTNETMLGDTSVKDKNGNIPTVITVDIEQGLDKKTAEKVLVGNWAIQKPLLRIFRELKTAARTLTPPNGTFGEAEKATEYPFQNCDLETSLQFGTDEYPIKRKAKELLREFFQQIFMVFGIDPQEVESLVVGRPAVNRKDDTIYNYKDILEMTFQGILKDNVTIDVVPEPELAGVTYLFKDGPNNEVTTVLVIDIGGGTTDFAVLTYEKGEIKYGVKDSCNVAGNAIDGLILSLLPQNFHTNKIICRQAKEQCFKNGESNVGDLGEYSDGKHLWLTYGSQKENDYISLQDGGIEQQVFEKIWKKLDCVLQAHEKPVINKVFFVGGSSAIPQLIEYLKKRLKDSEKVDRNFVCETLFNASQREIVVPGDDKSIKITPYNAVAIGACIQAYGEGCVPRPKIEIETDIEEALPLEKSKTNILMLGKEKYTPICHYIFPPDYQYLTMRLKKEINIEWKIDGEKHNYGLTIEKSTDSSDSTSGKNLLFVLGMRQNKEIEFCVYVETGKNPPTDSKRPQGISVSDWLKSNGLLKAAENGYIKKIITMEEGKNNIIKQSDI